MRNTRLACLTLILFLLLPANGFGQPQKGLLVYLGDRLTFDERNRGVYLGDQFRYQEFTVSAWIRPGANQPDWAAIVDNNHNSNQSFAIHQHGGSPNQYVFGIHSATSEAVGVSFTLQPGVWTHMILIKNRESLSAVQNGKVIDSKRIPIHYTISYGPTPFLHLGRWGAGGRYWSGDLYHVRIYDRAPNAREVSEIWKYEGRQAPPTDPEEANGRDPN